jgi:hypothetical protein
MLKRTAAIVLAVTFLSLAIAPETLAFQRNRRAGCDRVASTYYSPSAYRGVAGTRYYSQPYYGSSYSQPYYGRSVGTRYYGQQYYGNRYDGSYYRGRRNSTRNLLLTVGAPAAIGGKGAGIGALVGGGGGALYYLLSHRGRR